MTIPVNNRRGPDRRARTTTPDRPTLRIPSGVCPGCRVYQAPANGVSGRCIACDRRIERRIRDRRGCEYRYTAPADDRPTTPPPAPLKEAS